MSERDDPFAFFKKSAGMVEPGPRNTAGEPEPFEEEEPYILPPLRPQSYTAFRLGKRRERMFIDRAAKPMRFPAYHELRDISFDQTHQQGGYLYFQAMTVEIMGRDLWPVFHAIASGRCAAVYEYHAKLYPAKPANGEPLIESIKLLPPEALADD